MSQAAIAERWIVARMPALTSGHCHFEWSCHDQAGAKTRSRGVNVLDGLRGLERKIAAMREARRSIHHPGMPRSPAPQTALGRILPLFMAVRWRLAVVFLASFENGMSRRIRTVGYLVFIAMLGGSDMAHSAQENALEAVTKDTFLFSDFTEHMLRTNQTGFDERRNPIMRLMKEKFLEWFPPGSDVKAFAEFLEEVTERELSANTIEDKSSFPSLNTKLLYSSELRQTSIETSNEINFQYKFNLKGRILFLNPKYFIMSMGDFSYNIHVFLENSKITSISVDRSTPGLW